MWKRFNPIAILFSVPRNFHIIRYIHFGPFQMYVSKLTNKKLPTDKPPWELRVISQSVDSSSTDTIIILRVHQCLADGMMLIKILCTKLADTRASYTSFKVQFYQRVYHLNKLVIFQQLRQIPILLLSLKLHSINSSGLIFTQWSHTYLATRKSIILS